MAESGRIPNPYAERWGRRTYDAAIALNDNNYAYLKAIIVEVWPDISFSYCQQIVLYHYFGDRSSSINNILAVRAHVFENPRENVRDGAKRLANCIERSPDEDKSFLAAMSIYNTGSYKAPADSWSNRSNYERSFELAKAYQ